MVGPDSYRVSRVLQYLGILSILYGLISSTGLSPSVINLSMLFDYQTIFYQNEKFIAFSDKIPRHPNSNGYDLLRC